MTRGKFITFEGGEGAGKSTQTKALGERLQSIGYEVLLTREPGGTERAEMIREILLEGKVARYGPMAEALLFSLARDDHLEKKIIPALNAGQWVICDRFMDSTRAYQGAGGGVSQDVLSGLEKIVVEDYRPDLTLLMDMPPSKGLARVKQRELVAAGGGRIDRFEKMDLAYHQRLREAFLAIARQEPDRCIVVDADQDKEEVENLIWQIVSRKLDP